MTDFNTRIIDEFRSNRGRVGGVFENQPLLLLHHRGARSGKERVSPLAYVSLDNGWAIFASKAGADVNPAWLHNLIANPETRIEVGVGTIDVRARLAEGDEHSQIWEIQKSANPVFAEYERKTKRPRIPVVVLEPRQDAPGAQSQVSGGS